ncbi:RidA family protein [Marinomonas atlantica]|uniref:RidA family protein n=1 Tax=Marinomonas atlantica TaxID=1806668 RepID=UPI000835AA1A|nr:Rid family detoxifying hydrolase [Marinomonas atlantica]
MNFINTVEAPMPEGAYAQATYSNGFVFVSGQLPLTKEGSLVEGVSTQTQQSLINIQAILADKGLSKESVMKVQIFTTDLSAFAEINDVYQTFFGEHTPARAVVEVSALPKGACVEIDAVAVYEDGL